MKDHLFWVLKKKMPGRPLPGPVYQLQDVMILELTEEGQSILWPELADREVPLSFLGDRNAEHQDIDSYMIDGSFHHTGGYFANLKEFMLSHSYSEEDLHVIELGRFPAITAAREAWFSTRNL